MSEDLLPQTSKFESYYPSVKEREKDEGSGKTKMDNETIGDQQNDNTKLALPSLSNDIYLLSYDDQLKRIGQSIRKAGCQIPKSSNIKTGESKAKKSTQQKKDKDANGSVGGSKTFSPRQPPVLSYKSTFYQYNNEDPSEPIVQPALEKSTSTNRANTSHQARYFNDKKDPPLMPPPFLRTDFPKINTEDEATASMLMSWYMAGYHTGYYAAMKAQKTREET